MKKGKICFGYNLKCTFLNSLIKKAIFLSIFALFFLPLISGLSINFDSNIPPNATNVNSTTLLIANITGSPLISSKFLFNNSNYSLYDSSLLVMLNMDNLSSLGENSTRVVDLSLYGSNYTFSGPTWTSSGKYSGAYTFAGNKLNIINESRLNNLTQFSLEVWVKPTSLRGAGSGDRIIERAWGANGVLLYFWESGKVNFDMRNASNSGFGSFISPFNGSAIPLGQWYHVVGVFNGTNSIVYVNGIAGSIGPTFINNQSFIGNPNRNFTIGSNSGSDSLFATVDEVRIWGRALNSSEVVEHYYSNFNKMNNNNWSIIVNQSLTQGKYDYSFCASNSSSEVCTESRTLFYDLGAPRINFILYTPNDTGNIDPGSIMQFNSTVIESISSVDSVILQIYNGQNWTNYSMNFISSNVYQYNFTTSSINTSYTFNIFFNDTVGNFNITQNQTLDSFWECTFDLIPSRLGDKSGFGGIESIGNLIIENTGDVNHSSGCTLNIRMSHNIGTGRILFDGLSLPSKDYYSILPKTNQTINLSAQFLDSTGQEDVKIFATDLQGISSTLNKNATATLISSSQQPYLRITNEGESAYTVYLTEGKLELKYYLQNVPSDGTQNTTAYNVSFNYTLPENFLFEGQRYYNFENLSNNSLIYEYLNLTFDSTNLGSLSPGQVIVYTYALGYNFTNDLIIHSDNQTLLSNNFSINLQCYNISDGIQVPSCGSIDPDNPENSNIVLVPGSGGGGGGGNSELRVEKSEANYELLRGGKQNFQLEIKNKYGDEMRNINISVSGLNSEYISILPNNIESLLPGAKRNITVTISAPGYFTGKKYNLIFDITGILISNTTSGAKVVVTDRRFVTLYIVEVARKDATLNINDSILLIEEMNASGLITKEVSALLVDQIKAYAELNFLSVKNIYEQIKKIRDNAFESKQLIDELIAGIVESEKNGITVIDSKKSLYLAEVAFARGDYALALERLKEAKLVYALEVKGEYNLIYTIKNNPGKSFSIAIFAGLFGWGSSILIRLQLYKRRLKSLGEEEVLLLELMKMVQRQCFEEKKLSMEEYDQAMMQYESKLSETIEDKIRTETKMANLLKARGKRKALDQEKARLIELIRKVQDDYLNKNKIETRIYEGMVRSYSTRLSEVDEQLAYAEAQEALKKQRKINGIFRLK